MLREILERTGRAPAVVTIAAVCLISTTSLHAQTRCEPGYRLEGKPKVCTQYWISPAIDSQGNLIVADTGNATIRQISSSGIVTTILNNPNGNGPATSGGYSGSGIPALSSNSNKATRPRLDQAGNIYFTQSPANVIQMINKDGQPHFGIPMTPGYVYTLAGRPAGAASKNGYSGDGGPATQAVLDAPEGLDLDMAGNIYWVDINNSAARMINADGLPHFGQAMQAGYIYTIAGGLLTPTGAPDCGFMGDGGLGTKAWLAYAQGLAVDSHGNVFIGDWENNAIRRIDAKTGIITHVAGAITDDNGNPLEGFHNCSGHSQIPAHPPNDGFSGDGGLAIYAKVSNPYNLIFDRFDNLYFSDRTNNVVRKIEAKTGIITTVIGQGGPWVTIGTGTFTAQQTTHKYNLTDAFGQPEAIFGIELFNGSTLLTALPVLPSANCLVGQVASAINDIPDGWPQVHNWTDVNFIQVTNDSTGAASFRTWATSGYCSSNEGGLMVDASMVSGAAASTTTTMDSGTVIPAEYRVLPDGTHTSVSWSGDGGWATEALLNTPSSLSVDMDFNLYFYDGGAFRYRMVPTSDGVYFGIPMLAGHIYTIAGDGHLGYWSGDGGPATAASF
jgi:hypothetical protein